MQEQKLNSEQKDETQLPSSPNNSNTNVIGSQSHGTLKGSVKIVKTFKGEVLSEYTLTEEEYNAISRPEPICYMIANPKNSAQFLWVSPKQYVEGLGYDEHIKLGLGRVTS